MKLHIELKILTRKIFVSDPLSRLHIDAEEDVHNMIPMNFLQHLQTANIFTIMNMVKTIYKYKAKQEAQMITKPKRGRSHKLPMSTIWLL